MKKRELIISDIFGLISAVILVIGKQIYNRHDMFNIFNSITDIVINISILVILTNVISELFFIFVKKINNFKINKEQEQWRILRNKKSLIGIFVIVFCSFLPALFAYYPGIFSYDIGNQTEQMMNGITMFHPPIHTFIWYCCYKINGLFGLEAITIYAMLLFH